MNKNRPINKLYLSSVIALTSIGVFIFTSASLGLLTRGSDRFISVITSQFIALLIGICSFIIFSKINYHFFKKNAFLILLGAVILNCLLFIPQLSFTHGGATRWLDIGITTVQPSEFLKLAFVIYYAGWISIHRENIKSILKGPISYLVIVGLLGLLLLAQRDTDTLIVISMAGLIMYFVGGGKKRHVAYIVLIGIIALTILVYSKPYIMQRIQTFFNQGEDIQGAGYQINQSLIAVGSGEWNGRGFGQSLQKFSYLPEPVGDSIFAVWAEEFGFIGSILLILIYIYFITMTLKIASNSHDYYGKMLALGIGVIIVVQSFMNIGSMIGVIPLSGMPLLFVSQGGTAIILVLTSSGIVANISRKSVKEE